MGSVFSSAVYILMQESLGWGGKGRFYKKEVGLPPEQYVCMEWKNMYEMGGSRRELWLEKKKTF